MRQTATGVLLLVLCLAVVPARGQGDGGFAVPAQPLLPSVEVHPSLWFRAADVPALRAKKDRDAYAAHLWDRLFGDAPDAWLSRYATRTVDSLATEGERAQFARLMAFAWIVNGDGTALRKAVDALEAAYALVPREEVYVDDDGVGRVAFDGPYDENYRAVWLQHYVSAYDWVQPALTAAEDARIRERFVVEVELLRVHMDGGVRYAPRPHNHRAKPACAIASAALALSGSAQARVWLRFALEQLNTVTRYQFRGGGVYREGGSYFRYVGLNLVPFLWHYRNVAGVDLFPYYQEAFEWPVLVRTVHGWTPNLEDGHLQTFPAHLVAPAYARTPTRLHSAAPLAEVLQWHAFASTALPDAYAGPPNHALEDLDAYLLYDPALARTPPAGPPTVRLDGGQVVFRSGWAAAGAYLLFHGVPAGDNHDHPDHLVYVVAARGALLVPDAGYGPDGAADDRRAWYTSPQAHATVTVDDAPLANFAPGEAGPEDVHFLDPPGFALAEKRAAVGGSDGGDVRRGVAFVDGRYWVVYDDVQAGAAVPVRLYLHGRGALAHEANRMTWTSLADRYGAAARLHAYVATTQPAVFASHEGWTSLVRGHEEPRAYVEVEQPGPRAGFLHLLYPAGPADAFPNVRDTGTGDALAFALAEGDGVQALFVMARAPGFHAAGGLGTDARFAWARRQPGAPDRLAMVDGTRLQLDGADVLTAEHPLTLVLERAETSPPGADCRAAVVYVEAVEQPVQLRLGLDGCTRGTLAVRLDGAPLAFERSDTASVSFVLAEAGRLEVVRLASTTSVAAAAPAAGFRLEAPYPAPFADRVRLVAELPAPADVVVRVYDLLGRRVRTLYEGAAAGGRHTWTWDGRGDDGSRLPAGRYFVEVRSGAAVARRSVVHVR